ncbi:ATP-binding protein [Sagittula salina]|uniref:ATP-binding protein n=1 Tax=Sagittula salina TaxID=2820268 RepID=A0A940MLH8_9RHOB|nr:ATP-binding protein [Sagittula salina]MBP0481554.1 ATP-binding protein [Sagittula salina]
MIAERLEGDVFSIHGTVAAVPDAVTAALLEIRQHLVQDGTARAPHWEIVVAEVLNNIVEHAFENHLGGEITLRLDFRPAGLCASFRDNGHAMPGGMLPPSPTADLDVPRADLPEGGFGWQLIRGFARRIDYHRRDGCNHLELDIPLADPAAGMTDAERARRQARK